MTNKVFIICSVVVISEKTGTVIDESIIEWKTIKLYDDKFTWDYSYFIGEQYTVLPMDTLICNENIKLMRK